MVSPLSSALCELISSFSVCSGIGRREHAIEMHVAWLTTRQQPRHQREVLLSSCFLVSAPHHVPVVSCKEGTAFLPFVAVNCYIHAMEGLKKATALKQLEPCKVLSAADLSPSSSSHSLLSWADWSSSAKHHASTWWEAGNVTTRREMTASRPACATTSY